MIERDNCGDQPCSPYQFIGNPPGRVRPESLSEVRERFLRFFERHGHTRINRYPVVARWRSDVYFVGASIYNFQPWVTEGIVPPPANPLVISQPSIRFTDIDKVGRSGRHLTGFEMMAHHAFNYPDRHVYWIDETVKYAYEFFTEELGIEEEDIVFKENVWEGGGNAGECFEVIIRGLEVATLVFMHYKVVNGKYVEMPIKVVDTGYGLERIYWLLTGRPTVYDAVFGPLIERLRVRIGIEKASEDLLRQMAVYFGYIDPEVTSVEKAYSHIASTLGLDVDYVRHVLRGRELLYLICDHGRTFAWMIVDGVIPSNSGIGYLARLLLRRILRSMHINNVEIPLSELLAEVLKFIKDDYPEVKEVEHTIVELADLEERKFKEVLSQASGIIEKMIRDKERRTGKKALDPDDLVLLYDSYGIPPEITREVASKLGIDVVIPDDFYTRLTARHQRREEVEEVKVKIDETVIADLPPTKELFYENPHVLTFRARVLKVIDDKYVILDRTAFYPEGGGQPADHGVIRHGRGEARVIDVQRVGRHIIHVIKGVPPLEGEEVECIIDDNRRFDLMRMHTATHILLRSIRLVLGRHVWQAGAAKDTPFSRLDVTHYKLPSREEVRKIEELANSIVMKDLPVITRWLNRTEAETRYGMQIYQGGFVPGAEIRIVQVGPDESPFDVEACCGLHVSRTGEIGLIKIVKVEKLQEGVIRFVFTSGRHALGYVQSLEEQALKASELLGIGKEDLVKGVERLLSSHRSLETRVKALLKKAIKADLEELKRREEVIDGLIFSHLELFEENRDYVQELAKAYLSERPNGVLLIANKTRGGTEYYVFTGEKSGVNAGQMVKAINDVHGGKGGGSRTYGQGFVKGEVSIIDLANTAREFLRRK